MLNRKNVIFLLITITLCFITTGCSLSSLSDSKITDSTDSEGISSTAYQKVNSQEEIFAALLETMQNNQNKCYICVPTQDLINADYWLTKLNGIEEIHCQYRKINDCYNVVVSLTYWDNYSIVHAYKTGNTGMLTPKQLELYNKYCDILTQYTSKDANSWDNELAIHDYLVSNIRYEAGDDAIYNAYDALINGKAVCNGYAECFKTFMDLLGIECTAISGSAGGELHIWNQVNLEGEWYQVDVTWDDPINNDGDIEHTYFNITDTDIIKDHTWDNSIYPAATGTRYSYPNVKGLPVFSDTNDLTGFLLSSLRSKEDRVEFATPTTFDLKSLIEKCGVNVTYSYYISNYSGTSVYKIEFAYQ